MKKQLSYSQRLALQVHTSVNSPLAGVCLPYGFKAYAKCAVECQGKKLAHNWY